MKLKDITCDLKYAKELQSLGAEQTKSFAVFYGAQLCGPTPFDSANQDLCGTLSSREKKSTQAYCVAAFTTDELLELLPKEIKHNFNEHSSYYLCMGYDGERGIPMAWYEDNDLSGKDEMLVSRGDKKLANALAKVLIWLLKHNKIKFVSKSIMLRGKELVPPTERAVYARIPRKFYSFKLNRWVLVMAPHMIPGSNMYWRDFIDLETGKKIDDCGEDTLAKLHARTLSNINNQNLF